MSEAESKRADCDCPTCEHTLAMQDAFAALNRVNHATERWLERGEELEGRLRTELDDVRGCVRAEVTFIRNLGNGEWPIEAGWPELTAALDRIWKAVE